MKSIIIIISVLIFIVFIFPPSVCLSPSAHAEDRKAELLVSAASSLKNVLTEVAVEFGKTHPGVKIAPNFAASGQLMAQIIAGAPVDVFISAAEKEMDTLDSRGLILRETRVNVTRNSLVVIVNTKTILKISVLSDLTGVRNVAVGNFDNVPAGRYAKEVLERSGLLDTLKPKLVFGESVRQVLDYVSRGEVDAGFIFASDALTDVNVRAAVKIDSKFHSAIRYPAAVVKTTQNADHADEFIKFLISRPAVAIFKKHGFK